MSYGVQVFLFSISRKIYAPLECVTYVFFIKNFQDESRFDGEEFFSREESGLQGQG